MTVARKALDALIAEALDRAQATWGQHGRQITTLSKAASIVDSVQSQIPGHQFVHQDITELGSFIALVADMRDSTDHLLARHKGLKVQGLERVYYETCALLPALALVVSEEGGRVTEYLGDGILAFFKGELADGEKFPLNLDEAYRAGRACIDDVRPAVNDAIASRYGLPAISLGVGLGWSPCIVQLVGLQSAPQAKAIGECVYRASKLAGANNELCVDPALECVWRKGKGGTLRFKETRVKDYKGFVVTDEKR